MGYKVTEKAAERSSKNKNIPTGDVEVEEKYWNSWAVLNNYHLKLMKQEISNENMRLT